MTAQTIHPECELLNAWLATQDTEPVIHDVHRETLNSEPGAAHPTVDAAFGRFFTNAPGWLDAVLRVRNAVLRPLGFETGDGQRPAVPAEPQPGDRVGLFAVLERSDDEIVMGGDDRHFSLRISIAVDPETHVLSVATAAIPTSGIGRAYLSVVDPFHGPLAAMVTRRMAR